MIINDYHHAIPLINQSIKSWLQDLGDCGECRKHENCNQKITFNIDLKNVRILLNLIYWDVGDYHVKTTMRTLTVCVDDKIYAYNKISH